MEIFVGCQTNSAGFWSDCCRGQVTPSLYFLVKQLLRCCWKNKLWPHWAWTTWDGVSLWDVVVAMLFKCCLEFSINTNRVSCFTVGTTHADNIRSPWLCLTKTQSSHLDSSRCLIFVPPSFLLLLGLLKSWFLCSISIIKESSVVWCEL